MLNFKILKDGLCAKCGGKLKSDGSFLNPILYCSMSPDCNFRIYESEYNTLVAKSIREPMKSKRVLVPAGNDAELQNLGHAKVAEDFSDSSALDN